MVSQGKLEDDSFTRVSLGKLDEKRVKRKRLAGFFLLPLNRNSQERLKIHESSLSVNPQHSFSFTVRKDYRRINESELSGKTQDSFLILIFSSRFLLSLSLILHQMIELGKLLTEQLLNELHSGSFTILSQGKQVKTDDSFFLFLILFLYSTKTVKWLLAPFLSFGFLSWTSPVNKGWTILSRLDDLLLSFVTSLFVLND